MSASASSAGGMSKCTNKFELLAAESVEAYFRTKFPDDTLDFDRSNPGKIIQVGDRSATRASEVLKLLGSRFMDMYKEVKASAKGQSTPRSGNQSLSGNTAIFDHVEYDFVAHVEPHNELTSTLMHNSPATPVAGGGTSSPAGTPEALPPAHEAGARDTPPWICKVFEDLQKQFDQCLGDENRTAQNLAAFRHCSRLLCHMTHPAKPPLQKFGYLPENIFQLLSQHAQQIAITDAKDKTYGQWQFDDETRGEYGRKELCDIVNTLETKVRCEVNKKDSPETDDRKVVLFEAKENGATMWALFQLELRLAVYLARRQARAARNRKPVPELLDVVQLAGIVVQSQVQLRTWSDLRNVWLKNGVLVHIVALAKAGAFEVLWPLDPPAWRDSSKEPFLRSAFVNKSILEEIPGLWVSVTLPNSETPITDVWATMKSLDLNLNLNIDGLKKAVKKELADELQGIGISRLTVYAPGKERQEGTQYTKMSTPLQPSTTEELPYHVVVQ